MEPLDYVRALQRRWWILLIAPLLAGAAAWATTPPPESVPETRVYSATHTMYDDPLEDSTLDVGLPTVGLLATVGEIPRRMVDRLGEDVQPAVLADEIEVVTDPALGTLTITSTQQEAERAEELVNTWASEIMLFFDERQQIRNEERISRLGAQEIELEEEVRALDAELADLPEGSGDAELVRAERDALLRQYSVVVEQLQQARDAQVGGTGLVTLEEGVGIPQTEGGFAAPRSVAARAAIGAGVGLLLAIGLALFLDRTDTRIHLRRDAERAFRLPVLTEIPRMRRKVAENQIITVTQPASFAAESYRILRLALQLAPRWAAQRNGHGEPVANAPTSGELQVILVTSAGPGEGKTSTVANVAASFAEIGKRVLVLDADFRNPHQHDYFDVPREPGISEFLTDGSRRPALAALTQATAIPGVRVVTNGAPVDNPGELVGPDVDLIESARGLADIVLVDAGPLLAVNDPSALIPKADAVVVSARSGLTYGDLATRTAELLSRIGAPVIGVSLTSVPRGSSGQPYYAQLRSMPGPARRRAAAQAQAPSTPRSEAFEVEQRES